MTEKTTLVLKSIQSFLKMYSEETCELIKINYWSSLEAAINKNGIDANETNNLIFNEIFKKNIILINDKNLVFLIFNYCFIKSTKQNNFEYADNFFCHIYDFLDLILQNYDNIFSYVKEYILEYSITLLSETNLENFDFNEDRKSTKIIFKYFSDFLEIDFPFFSTSILGISNQIYRLLKNKVFKQIFKKFLKNLLISNSFSSLIYMLNYISKDYELNIKEKIELISYFIELSINIGNFNQQDNSLITDEMGKIFYFEILKSSVDLVFGKEKNLNRENELDLNEFCTILEKYLLFIIENSKNFANLILENNKIFNQFFDDKLNENMKSKLKKFKKVFPLCLLNLTNKINSFSSLEKLGNILNTLKIGFSNIKSKFICKIIQKIFLFNGKLKGFPKEEYFKLDNVKIFLLKEKLVNNNPAFPRNLDIDYRNDITNLKTISNLNLFGYIIENTLIEFDSKIYFDQELFYNLIEIVFSIDFDQFDIEFQNELIKNLFLLIFVIFENIENGLDFFDKNTQKILCLVFYYLKIHIKPQISVNEIYPILISLFQSIFFPKISKICNESILFEYNFSILNSYFDFLISFARIDSIANITSKFLITILNIKGCNLKIKIFALEKFVNLSIVSNTAKYYLVFFNNVTDSIKKINLVIQTESNNKSNQNTNLINENTDILNVYYYSLWDLILRYQGALPFEILTFFTNKFEECLNRLPEEQIKFEHLIAIEAINLIIIKDQNQNLFELMLENVLNMKFMKIFDKLFQRAESIESNIINLMEFFLVDEYKINNYESNLFILFNKNFKIQVLENLKNQDFIYLLLIIFLSRLFSGFISNLILHNKNKFDSRTVFEKTNPAINSILKSFDYISASVIFLSDEKKTFSHLLFINEMFSNGENLNFFYNTHSYLTAIENIEKNNLDYSMLNETNKKIISEKNKNLFFYTKYNNKGLFFFKKTILNILMLEINSLSLIENKHNINSSMNINILNSVYLDSTKNYIVSNHSGNKNISSSYLKYLLDCMFNIKEMNSTFNNNLYYFCLSERVFENLFKNCFDLLNVDVINICLYGILHKNIKTIYPSEEDCSQLIINTKEHNRLAYIQNCFLDYLLKYTKISKSALQFTLRILGNFSTFSKLLVGNNTDSVNEHTVNISDCKLEIQDKLFSLIDFVISNVLFYNSYNMESYDNIINILNNIKNTADFNYSYLRNLNCLGKIISNLYVSLSSRIKLEGTQGEINKKLKDQLTQTLINDFLYFYLDKILDLKNNQLMDLIRKEFDKYFENILIFKNLKKIKLLKETNNELCIRKFEEMEIFKILFLITDLSIPTYLHNIIISLIGYYKNENSDMKFIVENFLNYNLVIFNNKKSAIDFMKNLILSQQEENSLNEATNKKFVWKDKFKIINFVLFDYVFKQDIFKFIKRKDLFMKIDSIKNIVGFIHFNIMLR